MIRQLDSEKERDDRGINPFTGTKLLREASDTNHYSGDFKKAAIVLFSRRQTFKDITERLQVAFPGYDLNTDKVKNFYMRFREEFLKARDEADGAFEMINEADEVATLQKALSSEAEMVSALVDRRSEITRALSHLNPVKDGKEYAILTSSLKRVNDVINEASGLNAKRQLTAARERMLIAIEMREEMVKRGLIPNITLSNPVDPTKSAKAECRPQFSPVIIDADSF
jgi:hypothetical protein